VDDAERVVVAMGSQASNGKVAVDRLREKGEKVGILIPRIFRPFPYDEIGKELEGKEVIVLDRSVSPGGKPPLFSEISVVSKARSVVGGLGGKDLTIEIFEKILSGEARRWI